MKVLVIEVSKPAIVQEIKGFNDMKKIIGGWIQMIPFTVDSVCFIDEEAKVRSDKQPVLNALATYLCNSVGTPLGVGDCIVGSMMIVGVLNSEGERDGEEHDVPEHVIKVVMEASANYVFSGDM